MGIGDGIIPDILNQQIYDNIYVISDAEALDTAKRLAREEGLMCGISSGTNVAAALKLAKKLGPGKTVVTVLPDIVGKPYQYIKAAGQGNVAALSAVEYLSKRRKM